MSLTQFQFPTIRQTFVDTADKIKISWQCDQHGSTRQKLNVEQMTNESNEEQTSGPKHTESIELGLIISK